MAIKKAAPKKAAQDAGYKRGGNQHSSFDNLKTANA